MEHPATEAANPASAALDRLDATGIVRLMNAEDARVAAAVGRAEGPIARAIDLVASRLRSGGRLVELGAGTSGRLAVLDAAECPPTFDTPPGMVVGLVAGGDGALRRAVEGAEDSADLAVADLDRIALSSADVVLGIATSGRTPYVLAAMAHARKRGAATIGLACTPGSTLAAAVDVAIEVPVGPEVITGSTRLKAGTATKLVLNTISTGAMVLLGKTHGNLMVDLRATNTKLRDRAARIVAALTGLAADEAAELLAGHAGEVKTAVVAFTRKVPTDEARALLAAAGGRLREALEGGPASEPARPAVLPSPRAPEGPLLLGIDGGGSGCRAVLAILDDGQPRVVGRGVAGTANPRLAGVPRAAAHVGAAVAAAFAAAGIAPRRAAAAVAGLAGTGRALDREAMEGALADLAADLGILTDAELVLGHAPGSVALVAGTGSIAVCRAPDGSLARAGGFGPLFGDEGSGHWIALEALAAAARMADGRGAPTTLLALLGDRLGAESPAALVERIHDPSMTRDRIAALAIDVERAAVAGDAVAASIVDRAAGALADLAACLRRRHAIPGDVAPPWELRLAGGLLLHSERLRHLVAARLAAWNLAPTAVTLVDDPAAAALSMAARRFGEAARQAGEKSSGPPHRPGRAS